jgi:molybdate transport system ATP-binding protein
MVEGLEVELYHKSSIPLAARISCNPGELLALVGPSGSGKSTVLRTIAGLNTPDNGTISCNGRFWLDTDKAININTRARGIGIVFQNYALFPHLSAIHNIMEGLSHLTPSERKKRAGELLFLVHLSGLEDRKPATLSGGQQQRVAVARALAREPNVLLLDEPFSAVDRATRQKLYRELVELRQQLAMPVILVTHDLDEAAMLADRLCILHHGLTLQSGPPFDVIAKPVSKKVARLIDHKNIFQGTVVDHDGKGETTEISWGKFTLSAARQSRFKVGKKIDWVIPETHVVLANQEEGGNVVSGVILVMVRLGGLVTISIEVKEASGLPLNMATTMLEISQHRFEIGNTIKVALASEGIHLMAS